MPQLVIVGKIQKPLKNSFTLMLVQVHSGLSQLVTVDLLEPLAQQAQLVVKVLQEPLE
jgi:hypothetical protein